MIFLRSIRFRQPTIFIGLCLLLTSPCVCRAVEKTLSIRVMTYNIRFDFKSDAGNRWRQRADIVAQQIQESGAQVVCLQEDKIDQIQDLQKRLPRFTFVGRGRNATGFGERTSILFRSDYLQLKEQGDFWLSDSPDTPGSNTWGDRYPRKVTWVVLQGRKGGPSIIVLNVHLPSGKKNAMLRERGVQLIRSWLLEKLKRNQGASRVQAAVLAGDFNAAPESNPHKLLTDNRTLPLLDVWEVIAPKDPFPGTYGGWEGLQTKKRIDWLLVAGKIRVRGCDKLETPIEGRFPSDHYPVVADLQIRF
ncbi:MAG: hypothetical protein CMJ74_12770 [Planctomycetaceae bacterium]|nr:hypothetical protein [Planctomycetaceae bacterium]